MVASGKTVVFGVISLGIGLSVPFEGAKAISVNTSHI